MKTANHEKNLKSEFQPSCIFILSDFGRSFSSPTTASSTIESRFDHDEYYDENERQKIVRAEDQGGTKVAGETEDKDG